MKYFTPKWASGEYPDNRADKIVIKYWRNVEKIKNKIPDHIYLFAKNISLHDGRIKKLFIDRNSNIYLRVVCGDLQKGYEEISIEYMNASLMPERITVGKILESKKEILFDEIDLSNETLVHRFLMYPYLEFEIIFSDFIYSRLPVTERAKEN